MAPLNLTFTHPASAAACGGGLRPFATLPLATLLRPATLPLTTLPLAMLIIHSGAPAVDNLFCSLRRRPAAVRVHQGSTHLLSSIHQARSLGCQTCAWPSRDSRRLLRGLGHSNGQRAWVTKMCLAKRLDARREPYLGEPSLSMPSG